MDKTFPACYEQNLGRWFVLRDGSNNRFKVIEITEQVYERVVPGFKVECYRPDGTKRMGYAVYAVDTFEADFVEVEMVMFKAAKPSKKTYARRTENRS